MLGAPVCLKQRVLQGLRKYGLRRGFGRQAIGNFGFMGELRRGLKGQAIGIYGNLHACLGNRRSLEPRSMVR